MKRILTAIALCASASAFAFGIENNGEVVMVAKLDAAPTTATAVGAASKALAGVNVMVGTVTNKAAVRMTADLKLSPTTATAVGAASDAGALVNGMYGR